MRVLVERLSKSPARGVWGAAKANLNKTCAWPAGGAICSKIGDKRLRWVASSRDVYAPINGVKDFGSVLWLSSLAVGIKYLMHAKRRWRRRARFLRLHLSPFIAQPGNQEDFFRASMKH
jgi:hypothetical protein